MQDQLPLGSSSAARVSSELLRSMLVGVAAGLLLLVAVYLGLGIAFVRALPAPAIELAVPATVHASALGSPLVLETVGWGTSIDAVRLIEFPLGASGQVLGEREVPVQYQASAEGRFPGESRGIIVRADGQPLLAPDTWYELHVRGTGQTLGWQGPRAVPLGVAHAFGTPLSPRPTLASETELAHGEPLAIAWNVPIAEFYYTLEPAVRSRAWLSADRQTAYIALEEFRQGAEFAYTVTDGRSVDGLPLRGLVAGTFTTPSALRMVGVSPDQGARDVAPGEDPILTFSAAVANPDAAEQAIAVDPPTDGQFRWLAPNRVQFVTEKGFPYSTDVRLTVEPGPEGLRSVDGGYVETESTLAYRTRVHKSIDVDLSRQLVRLLEDGQVVYTTTASTGVRGAETPTGHHRIQYKMLKTRMRGVNPSGLAYDIPDVPWVMALFDDYAFHGAPWRQAWGVPQSNGCVSMPTPNAKFVFDWTPVGTPVYIHY